MKKLLFVLAILLLLCIILSAGCIGATTSDIVVGGNTIGKVTLTPQENLFSGGSLTDKVNMEVELFGIRFTKDGITQTEAADIMSLLNAGDINILNSFSKTASEDTLDLSLFSSLFGESDDMPEISEMMQTAGTNFEKLITGINGLLAE